MPYASRAAGATPLALVAPIPLVSLGLVSVGLAVSLGLVACGGSSPPANDSTSVTVSHGALGADAGPAPADGK